MSGRADWEDDDWTEAIVRVALGSDATPGPVTYESTHPEFQKRLAMSKRFVDLIAGVARAHGRKVVQPETKIAPTRSVADRFSDQGDLFIDGEKYEVKGLTRSFSGRHDWPFGEHFIVDGKGTYDKKKPKPRYYITVSWDMKAAAMVDVLKTRPEWTVGDRLDGNLNEMRPFYFCPIDKVRFYSIE